MMPSWMKQTTIATMVLGCFGSHAASAAQAPATAPTGPIAGTPAISSYAGDPGVLYTGPLTDNVAWGNAAATWRTNEFLRDIGMRSIGADFAYAAGYAGKGVAVGLV